MDDISLPIPYGRQSILEKDIKEVVGVLGSDYLTQGPKIVEFEKDFLNLTKASYAFALNSGTAALHLCMMGIGLKPGDRVIITWPKRTSATIEGRADEYHKGVHPESH